ncbi:MAG: hypothetical protein A2X22_06040 [Bacteroidetes bacterium GWF2_49_14]|nr:MAG: hypothetical protein A2X22_06040 [Bacteroidetes bacterium GWF2_49_14]
MKPTNFLYLISGLLITALISCELILDVEVPDADRKIVVNGLISPDQSVVVHLSKSLNVLEDDLFIPLIDADVQLLRNNDVLGKLVADSGGYYHLPEFMPLEGATYKLSVDYPGMTSVSAEAFIPSLVPISSWDTATIADEWGSEVLNLNIRFDDPDSEANLYGLAVSMTFREFDYMTMKPTGKWITQPAFVYAGNDQFLQDESHYFGGKIYFDDKIFNGQTKTMKVSLYEYQWTLSDTIKVDIQLEQVDKPFYKYVVSNEAYQAAHNNPFAEPVQVFTNIIGGFGIFSGYSFSSQRLLLFGKGLKE